MSEITDPVRSPQEIAAAISDFSHAQWARLERVGAKYAWKAGWSADDLVQEALARAVAGDRKCPHDVDVIRFLAEAMRGIADDEANKLVNQARHVPIKRGAGEDDHGVEPADARLNVEQAIVSEEEAAAVRGEIKASLPMTNWHGISSTASWSATRRRRCASCSTLTRRPTTASAARCVAR